MLKAMVSRAPRALPARARLLHATPARLGMLTTSMPTSNNAVIDPDKFVDGESLVEHQARVRHDNPDFRTHIYARIGAPPRPEAIKWEVVGPSEACRAQGSRLWMIVWRVLSVTGAQSNPGASAHFAGSSGIGESNGWGGGGLCALRSMSGPCR